MDFMSMLKNARKEASLQIKSSQPVFELNNFSQTYELSSINSVIFKNSIYNQNTIDFLMSKFEDEQETDWVQVGGRKVAIFGGVPHPSGAILEKLPKWLCPMADQLIDYFNGDAPNQVLLNRYDETQGIEFHNDGPLYFPSAAILSFSNDALLEFRYACANTSNQQMNHSPSTSTSADIDKIESNFSIYLPPNSLLAFSNNAYKDYNHGITATTNTINQNSNEDTSNSYKNEIFISENCLNAKSLYLKPNTYIIKKRNKNRFSLTFRRVAHVSKIIDEFGPCNEEEKHELKRRKLWWLQSITDTK